MITDLLLYCFNRDSEFPVTPELLHGAVTPLLYLQLLLILYLHVNIYFWSQHFVNLIIIYNC